MSNNDRLSDILAGFFMKKSTMLHTQVKFEDEIQQKAYELGLNDAEAFLVQSVNEAGDVSH